MEALRAIVDSNNGKHAAIAERDARIAALEAELAEAKREMELDLSLFEEAEQQAVKAEEKAAADIAAAVQAERERCLYWRHRLDLTPDERTERIKNGDPAP